jgi:DNA-binding transcriptional regulator YiaG
VTASQFRAHLWALRWSQRGFAAFVGVPHNTVHRWALGQAVVPERMAVWLETLIIHLAENPPPK